VQAEEMVLRYAAEKGLPAVAMCVSTTYGSGDWGRTPHGAFIAGAVYGKLPFLMNGIQLEVVGVDDAARAMLQAAERGRIGERYLISERMIPLKEVVKIAAEEAGVPAPKRAISVPVLYAMGALGSLRARMTGKDAELSMQSVRMMRAEAPVDHSKAVRELGWQPRPVEESIREAARFWANLKNAKLSSKPTPAD
jgi:dihydroflavonol-4-reductase